MLGRCASFGDAEAASFPAASLGGKLFAELRSINAELDASAARQSSGRNTTGQGTTTKGDARDNLRDDLEAISRTARAIAEVTPGLEDKFRLPRGRANDQELLAAARAFAADALPMKATFIEYGMPADFLEDLAEDIQTFVDAVELQETGKRDSAVATAAIDDLISRGMQIVRRLDAIVHNILRDKPDKLAGWERARHVERLPKRKKETPPPK
jgi:hypothetical protein